MDARSRRLPWSLTAFVVALVAGLWAWRCASAPATEDRTAAPADSGHARATPTSADAFEPDWQAPAATVRGHVRAPDGTPVGGAQVCAWLVSRTLPSAMGRTPRCTASEADGRYRLDALPPVTVTVHAQRAGDVPAQRYVDAPLPLAAGREHVVDLELAPGGVPVQGVVRDLAGGVVEGALVVVTPSGPFGHAVATTDADGTFSTWTAPGEVVVRAVATGYATAERDGPAPGYTFELFVIPESVLVGRVVDAADGSPVEGALVRGGAVDPFEMGGVAVSDASGRFVIDGLTPGRYQPTASSDAGFGRAAQTITVGLAETSDERVIELHPAGRVAGRVVGADDEGCTQGTVRLLRDGGGEDGSIFATTGADGEVVFRGLRPGVYRAYVACRGYLERSDFDTLEVGPSPVEGLRWSLAVGHQASGIVVAADGSPIAGAEVDATDARAETDIDGRFSLEGLMEREYGVIVRAEGFQRSERVPFVVTAEGAPELRLVLAPARDIAGRVVTTEGDAVAGASVYVDTDWASRARTTDDGKFRIRGVAPGRYEVIASVGWDEPLPRADGDRGTRVDVGTDDVTGVEIVVVPHDATISGRVVDSDGSPVADAFVDTAREPDDPSAPDPAARLQARFSGWGREPVLTDADGLFDLPGLAEGSYAIRAWRKGGGEAIARHASAPGEVELSIEDTATIRGQVDVSGDAPPSHFDVTVQDRAQGVHRVDTFSGTDGAFTIDALPAGTYQVSVASDLGEGDAEVAVAAGELSRPVTVALSAYVTVVGRFADAASGEPIAGLKATTGETSFLAGRTGPDVSDAAGRFAIEGVRSGRVVLIGSEYDFHNPRYTTAWVYATVPAGAGTYDVGDVDVVGLRLPHDEPAGDLGFELADPGPADTREGVTHVVGEVRPGGPADAAGLRVGDEVVSVDGIAVSDSNPSLFRGLSRVAPGITLTLGLADGRTLALKTTPAPPE